MNAVEFPYAGLILPDAEGMDKNIYLDAAETALTRHDPNQEGGVRRIKGKNSVLGMNYAVRVRIEEDSDYGPKVMLEIVMRKGVKVSEEKAARILSDAVLLALEESPADIIEWFSPDVLLDSVDFIRLRSYVSPQRLTQATNTDDLELSCSFRSALEESREEVAQGGVAARIETLKNRMRDMEPAEVRMGIASWAMTAVLAMVSLPVAVAVSIIGLVRGIDFRLTTQALSVTALFVALENANGLTSVLGKILH